MIRREEKNKITDIDEEILNRLNELPADYWDFKDSDTSELVHGIHSYPAMMIYPISRNLIKIVKDYKEITTLLDPFAGSGTVLVEGMLANITKIYGNDLNPLARLLSKVKTTPLNILLLKNTFEEVIEEINQQYEKYGKQLVEIDDYIINIKQQNITEKKGWGDNAPQYLKEYFQINNIDIKIPEFKNLGFWFRPRVIFELQIIKDVIKKIKDKDIKEFYLVVFSETIRLVSNKRNGEFKMYRMPAEKILKFNPDVKNTFKKQLEKNIEKEKDFIDRLDSRKQEVRIINNNAKELKDILDDSIDLIITSPPYGDSKTTVAYGEFSRLSLQWLELENVTEENIRTIDRDLMGGVKLVDNTSNNIHSNTFNNSFNVIKKIDEKRAYDIYSFYFDLEKIIETLAKKTKEEGYQFWVVGNRTVKQENLKTDIIIREISKNYGMKYLCTIDRNILNKVMPSRNSPTNESGKTVSTMVNEHIVVLKKDKN
jgi:site-specific DNA-adenine methylase